MVSISPCKDLQPTPGSPTHTPLQTLLPWGGGGCTHSLQRPSACPEGNPLHNPCSTSTFPGGPTPDRCRPGGRGSPLRPHLCPSLPWSPAHSCPTTPVTGSLPGPDAQVVPELSVSVLPDPAPKSRNPRSFGIAFWLGPKSGARGGPARYLVESRDPQPEARGGRGGGAGAGAGGARGGRARLPHARPAGRAGPGAFTCGLVTTAPSRTRPAFRK